MRWPQPSVAVAPPMASLQDTDVGIPWLDDQSSNCALMPFIRWRVETVRTASPTSPNRLKRAAGFPLEVPFEAERKLFFTIGHARPAMTSTTAQTTIFQFPVAPFPEFPLALLMVVFHQ